MCNILMGKENEILFTPNKGVREICYLSDLLFSVCFSGLYIKYLTFNAKQ